jgi:exopolysaccharide biosynthesis polyprenyl glycosylphosphotransferase
LSRRGTIFWSHRLLWVAGDGALAAAALYAAFQIRFRFALPFTRALLPEDRIHFYSTHLGAVLISQVLLLYLLGFYDPPRPRPRLEIARGLIRMVVGLGLLLAGAYFLVGGQFPRSVLLLFLLLDLAFLVAWRWLVSSRQHFETRRVAIVGTGTAAREVAATIDAHHWHGLVVAGFVPAPEEERVGEPAASLGRHLGTLEDLPDLIGDGVIDDVILAPSSIGWPTRLLDRLAAARKAHTSLLLLPGPFESLIGRMRYRWVHDLPLIEVVRESEWHLRQPMKRLLDVSLGSLLLLGALPVMGVCALVVRVTSPGPVLYRQVRIGRGRRPFTLLKLRTMREDAERDTGEVLAELGDPRLTSVGALLRRYRLDEMPQLFNVLGGSMSLVGPRPERPGFVARYLEEVPGYAERFSIQPGLTGLAQVNGEYHSSAQNKLRYDLAYLANRNLWLDLSILFRTAKIVLTSRGT